MIVVNGHKFRKNTDPIYANGKRVVEAYANGVQVYPETVGEGTLLKVAGWRDIYPNHTHVPFWAGTDIYSNLANYRYYYTLRTSFHMQAQFVALLESTTPVNCSRVGPYPVIPADNGHHETTMENYSYIRHLTYPSMDIAHPDVWGLSVWRDHESQYGEYFYVREIQVKYYISPIPNCGPVLYRINPNSSSPFRYYGTDIMRKVSDNTYMHVDGISGPMEGNGHIYSNNGGESNFVVFDDGVGMWTRHWAGNNDTEGVHKLFSSVSINAYLGNLWTWSSNRNSDYRVVRWEIGYVESEPTIAPVIVSEMDDVTTSSLPFDMELIRIPVTTVLWSGDKVNAPESAKRINPEDFFV